MKLIKWMFEHPVNLYLCVLTVVLMFGAPAFVIWRHQALKNAAQTAPMIIEATVTPLALETLNLPSTPTATPIPANPWQPVAIGVNTDGGQAAVLLFNTRVPEAQIVYLSDLGQVFVTGNVSGDQAVLTFAYDLGQSQDANGNIGLDYQVMTFQFTPEANPVSEQTCFDACYAYLAYNQVEMHDGEPSGASRELWSFLADRGQVPIRASLTETGVKVELLNTDGNMLLSATFPNWVDTVIAGVGQWYR